MLAVKLSSYPAQPPYMTPVPFLTCRARCTASANASFLTAAVSPGVACPPRGAPDADPGTVLYSDMSARYRREKVNRKPGTELRRSGKESQEERKENSGDATAAGKVQSLSYAF